MCYKFIDRHCAAGIIHICDFSDVKKGHNITVKDTPAPTRLKGKIFRYVTGCVNLAITA